ncbi:MAG: hypothetical protein H8E48_02255 [Chloroflexi bacterium]|nr:hypothetical protein [Chloroflexota bacterium]
MFYFKACPKCQGDLSLEKDSYGSYFKCLQCGKFTEVNEANDQRSVLHGSDSNEQAVKELTARKDKTTVAA